MAMFLLAVFYHGQQVRPEQTNLTFDPTFDLRPQLRGQNQSEPP